MRLYIQINLTLALKDQKTGHHFQVAFRCSSYLTSEAWRLQWRPFIARFIIANIL